MNDRMRMGVQTRGAIVTGLTVLGLFVLAGPALNLHGQTPRDEGEQPKGGSFRFRSGVDLVNVTASVTDNSGRFVGGLRQQDFEVYEDGELQTISFFSSDRVPVSLGIVVDTSGSMAGEKMESARAALDRFVYDLLDPEDEIFIYRFNERPDLLETWTSDRKRLSRALARLNPRGGTAMYDAVAEAVPLAQTGQNRKKALVIISDGNDTNSQTSVRSLKQLVRESEVLIYAVGIDGNAESTWTRGAPRQPLPIPFPIPGRRGPAGRFPPIGGGSPGGPTGGPGSVVFGRGDDRVNVEALRELTDDSGGRTELVRSGRDLDPATESIADELSKQYYVGYSSTRPKDGKWHNIEVRVRDGQYRVRARRGYISTP
jgi:VWFA-related protein